ncbi:MinD/ParA family ATP-binding protein [Streptomyces lycii]|uniref:MinD/ParA family ATP-binding protein n=1 Tax=Streptomyces lycii TaxID=2654337 RepID=UPI001F3A0C40|nr:hypothetical protein [Streptomyces lycii]
MTTAALALAAAWPTEMDGGVRPVVVEADGSGGDLLVRFGLSPSPSLLDVAAMVGQRYPGSLLGAVHELPFGVRAVVAVPGRGPCREAVRLLATESGLRVLMGEGSDRGTVLLDAGRLGEDVEPLLARADRVLLVARGGAEPLTHMSMYGLGDRSWSERAALALVGPCPYAPDEVAKTVGVARVGSLPWDARAVAAISDTRRTALRTRRWRTPPLVAAARAMAQLLIGEETQMPSADRGADAVAPVGSEWVRAATVRSPGEKGALS